MRRRTRRQGERDGFLFQLRTVLLMCVLLVLNVAFVASLFRTAAREGPEWLRHPKVEQMILLIGPLIVLVIQWWLIDVLKYQLGGAGKRDQ
ncbi:MAG: hypothetical protein VX644_02410 [Planctomycetota bacterium]|nr:hypothetical protein [Planctomycetota bacterium]